LPKINLRQLNLPLAPLVLRSDIQRWQKAGPPVRVRDLQRWQRWVCTKLPFIPSSSASHLVIPSGVILPEVEALLLFGLGKGDQAPLLKFDQVVAERMKHDERKSGEPGINHPRRIVNQMVRDGISDREILMAAQGHDLVEDNFMTLAEVEAICGPEVRALVDAETKLSKDLGRETREKESLIKFIEAAYQDPRVIILKAYDNWDNWLDQEVFLHIPGQEHKPGEHAEETLKVYAPFMHAFNFWVMRVRLEDKALEYHDAEYAKNIDIYYQAIQRARGEIDAVAHRLREFLAPNKNGIQIVKRTKTYSEIWRKCQEKGMSMAELFNAFPLYAHYISIVTPGSDTVACHRVRGKVDKIGNRARLFVPEPRSINNLERSRENGYRAMHTYVALPGQGVFMIGYTTAKYDLDNRYGIVAEGLRSDFAPGWAKTNPEWFGRLRHFVREARLLTVKEMRDNFPSILTPTTVFTPKREEIKIDEGDTALDFALGQGLRNVGEIFVNGVRVQAGHILNQGDVVEVRQEGPRVKPHPNWLLSVHNHRSSSRIRELLRASPLARQQEIGIETLNQMLSSRFLKWSDVESSSQVRELLEHFSAKYSPRIAELIKAEVLSRFILKGRELTAEAFVIMVGLGEVDTEAIEAKFEEIYQASLVRQMAESSGTVLAVHLELAVDRIGYQQEIGNALASIGLSIMGDKTRVREDDSVGLAYVFNIHSTIQRRQIEAIVRKSGAELKHSQRTRENAYDFDLDAWLKKSKITI